MRNKQLWGRAAAFAAVVCWCVGAGSAVAQDQDFGEPFGFATAIAFNCTFTGGNAASLDGGGFQLREVGPLTMVFSIDDEHEDSARMIGDENARIVTVGIGETNISFVEVPEDNGDQPIDSISTTTVYALRASTGEHVAVHSRHARDVGTPEITQIFGSCKVFGE